MEERIFEEVLNDWGKTCSSCKYSKYEQRVEKVGTVTTIYLALYCKLNTSERFGQVVTKTPSCDKWRYMA
jgi:hypothetical protein